MRWAMVRGGSGSTWGVKKEAGLGRIGGGRARGAPAVPTDVVSGRGGVGQRKHDGGEFRLVEVALIAVIENNVPDEFVVCGDVMVCDHAVIPQTAEPHPDVASDEGMRRGWWFLRVGKSRS